MIVPARPAGSALASRIVTKTLRYRADVRGKRAFRVVCKLLPWGTCETHSRDQTSHRPFLPSISPAATPHPLRYLCCGSRYLAVTSSSVLVACIPIHPDTPVSLRSFRIATVSNADFAQQGRALVLDNTEAEHVCFGSPWSTTLGSSARRRTKRRSYGCPNIKTSVLTLGAQPSERLTRLCRVHRQGLEWAKLELYVCEYRSEGDQSK